jgi:hypothetical protein
LRAPIGWVWGSHRSATLRRWLLGILALGLLGTVIELLFLEHYEEPLQFVPLLLIVTAAGIIFWELKAGNDSSLRAFRVTMWLFVVSSFIGIGAHFYGSAEFQLENDPTIGTWDLLMKIIHAQAPPLLAPGMMLQLGLIGLSYVYSDPRYWSETR